MTSNNQFFSGLANELVIRAARATVSQASPTNAPLLRHLQETLEVKPGTAGSFLAPPLFESLFPWEQCATPLGKVPFLEPGLVRAMDAPPKDLAEYAFPAARPPYVHQLKAWEHLNASPASSVIVRTGTASGKTECFLVPILNDLVRESVAARTSAPLVGVRALFLYPLNALINSQRDRLLAWSAELGGRVRFCLYNGNTPESVRDVDQAKARSQILSRKLLRAEPPPIRASSAMPISKPRR